MWLWTLASLIFGPISRMHHENKGTIGHWITLSKLIEAKRLETRECIKGVRNRSLPYICIKIQTKSINGYHNLNTNSLFKSTNVKLYIQKSVSNTNSITSVSVWCPSLTVILAFFRIKKKKPKCENIAWIKDFHRKSLLFLWVSRDAHVAQTPKII